MLADAPTLEQLYRQYGHAVFDRCRYLLGNDDAAWDATQEVFLKADKGRHGFEGRSSWHTWLSRIATHHCLNVLRSQKVRRGKGHVDSADLDRFKHSADVSETAAMVRNLLGLFDAQTQQLAIHYYVDEMSQQEVAEAVGLSVPTVRKRLRGFVERARQAMTPGTVPVRRAR